MNKEVINQIKEIFPEQSTIGFIPIDHEGYNTAIIMALPYYEDIPYKPYKEENYHIFLTSLRATLDEKATAVEKILADHGIGFYRPQPSQKDEIDLLAEFPFKESAIKAGLGFIGKNCLFISYTYGPRVRLSAILVKSALAPELWPQNVEYKSLCGDCRICVDACPHHSLKNVEWAPGVNREDIIDIHHCNARRSLYIKNHGRKHACGFCLLSCPFGRK